MPSCWGAAGARRAGYIDVVQARHRYPTLVRTVAAAVALVAAVQGSGVPMCASLLAEAATPCAMHSTSVEHAHDPATAILVAVPAGHGTCHVDAGALGCAAGGACPTGGIAAPAWLNIPIGPRVASRTVAAGPSSALISYLAPPLAPPPQA